MIVAEGQHNRPRERASLMNEKLSFVVIKSVPVLPCQFLMLSIFGLGGASPAAHQDREEAMQTFYRIVSVFALALGSIVISLDAWGQTDRDLAAQLGVSDALIKAFRSKRSLASADIARLSPSQVARLSRRLRFADLQGLRQKHWGLGLPDESGSVPTRAIDRALQEMQDRGLRLLVSKSTIGGVPVGPIAKFTNLTIKRAGAEPGRWTAIGPANVGGRTRSVVIHPSDPKLIWLGSIGGGVWLSDSGGNEWRPVDDRMANLVVSTMAMDPKNPRTIYAGTGEHFTSYAENAIRGAGIFWTTDGEKWSQIDAAKNFEFVNRIAVSADGRVVLAATTTGLFRSDDMERRSWSKVSAEILGTVVFHPTDPKQAVAGGLTSGVILYSDDGGLKWYPAQSTVPLRSRVELTYTRTVGATIVYASVNIDGGKVLRSTNGGQSFNPKSTVHHEKDGVRAVEYLGVQGVYNNAIWAGDPTDDNLVIVGGIDLWRSKDGGDTFERISRWQGAPRSAHADHHAIVSHPAYDGKQNRIVFFANDGGVYRSDDVVTVGNDEWKEKGWVNLNMNYAVMQLYGGAAGANGRLIVGAQDNGTWLLEANRESRLEAGDGGWCAADPKNPDALYGEYVFLNIFRAVPGRAWPDYISGTYWDEKSRKWKWKPQPYSIPDARTEKANFIAPFVIDTQAPNRILAGGRSLWRTEDAMAELTPKRGPRWRQIKKPADKGQYIAAIAISPLASDMVWVCHNGGEVYLSVNATKPRPKWSLVSDSPRRRVSLPKRNCLSIALDPKKTDIAYITFSGFTKGNIWKTSNRGADWIDISGNLPAVPIRSVTVHPNRPDFVYVGTEIGLFATEKGGFDWSPTNDGPVNTAVSHLFWQGEHLMAATYGRGLFSIQIP